MEKVFEEKNKLNELIKNADEDIKKISKFTYAFIYQISTEIDSFEEEGFINTYWRSDVATDINNILNIIDNKLWLDIQYLIKLKLIFSNSKDKSEFKNIANSFIFNDN